MQSATPPPPEEPGAAPSSHGPAPIRHERGRLAPSLPVQAPLWRRIRRTIYRLGHGLVLHDVLLAAPAMAFHFFLSLLPLLVFVGYVVGLIARRRGVEAVLSPVLDNLPGTAEVLVKKEVERLAGAGGTALGPVAALSFLWIASGGTHGLMNAVETVVGAPRRPWWQKRLLAMAWVTGSLAAFALASFAIVKWDAVVHPRDARPTVVSVATGVRPSSSATPSLQPGSVVPLLENPKASAGRSTSAAGGSQPEARRRRAPIVRSSGEHALALTLSVGFATAVLATFYRVAVKHARRVRRRVLPGAVLAVILWLVVSWAFGVYVASLAEYAVFYGSLAAVAVLLVWLWLTSLAILVGAELNSQLEGLRD